MKGYLAWTVDVGAGADVGHARWGRVADCGCTAAAMVGRWAVEDPARRLSLVPALAPRFRLTCSDQLASNMLECRQEVAFDVARHAT